MYDVCIANTKMSLLLETTIIRIFAHDSAIGSRWLHDVFPHVARIDTGQFYHIRGFLASRLRTASEMNLSNPCDMPMILVLFQLHESMTEATMSRRQLYGLRFVIARKTFHVRYECDDEISFSSDFPNDDDVTLNTS